VLLSVWRYSRWQDEPPNDKSAPGSALGRAARSGIDSLPEALKATAAPNGTQDAAIDAAVGLSGEEAAACYAHSLVRLKRIDPDTVSREAVADGSYDEANDDARLGEGSS
jgi:hypothetical protein